MRHSECQWFCLDLQSDLTVLVLVLVLSASDEALQGRLQDLDRSFSFPQSALAVHLSTARAGLTHCPEARAFLQANWPIRGQDGHRDDRCRDTRYQVFRDLRGQGFYLTSAGKFGGDFLVYPGECFKFTGFWQVLVLEIKLSIWSVLVFR